jgi:hypothetical protein
MINKFEDGSKEILNKIKVENVLENGMITY